MCILAHVPCRPQLETSATVAFNDAVITTVPGENLGPRLLQSIDVRTHVPAQAHAAGASSESRLEDRCPRPPSARSVKSGRSYGRVSLASLASSVLGEGCDYPMQSLVRFTRPALFACLTRRPMHNILPSRTPCTMLRGEGSFSTGRELRTMMCGRFGNADDPAVEGDMASGPQAIRGEICRIVQRLPKGGAANPDRWFQASTDGVISPRAMTAIREATVVWCCRGPYRLRACSGSIGRDRSCVECADVIALLYSSICAIDNQ